MKNLKPLKDWITQNTRYDPSLTRWMRVQQFAAIKHRGIIIDLEGIVPFKKSVQHFKLQIK